MIAEEDLEDDEEEKKGPIKRKIVKYRYLKKTNETKGNAKNRKEVKKQESLI